MQHSNVRPQVCLLWPGSLEELPLGLLSVGSSLRRKGAIVNFLAINPRKFHIPADLHDWLRRNIPSSTLWAGMSVSTAQVEDALRLSIGLKTVFPSIPIIWGGPHPTFVPQQVMSHPCIDGLVRGDGTEAAVEITRRALAGEPLGVFEGKGEAPWPEKEILLEANRLFCKDSLPVPIFAGWSDEAEEAAGNENQAARQAKLAQSENLAQFLGKLAEESNGLVCELVDSDLLAAPPQVLRLASWLAQQGASVAWSARGALDHLALYDDEQIELLRRGGLRGLTIRLPANARKLFVGVGLKHLSRLVSQNIAVKVDWMLGFPGQSTADLGALATLLTALRERLNGYIAIMPPSLYRPLPGSGLFQMACQGGFQPPRSLEGWAALWDSWNAEGSMPTWPWQTEEERKLAQAIWSSWSNPQAAVEGLLPSSATDSASGRFQPAEISAARPAAPPAHHPPAGPSESQPAPTPPPQALKSPLRMLKWACETGVRDVDFWTSLSGVLARQGRHDEAMVAIGMGLGQKPDHVPLLISAGELMTYLGDLEGARLSLSRAVALEPGLVQCWVDLMRLHARMGSPGEAIACCRRAIGLGEQADLFYELGMLYNFVVTFPEKYHIGIDDVFEAFQKAIDLDPRHQGALYWLAKLKLVAGDHQAALALLQRLTEAFPQGPAYHFHLAWSLEWVGDPVRARQEYAKLVDLCLNLHRRDGQDSLLALAGLYLDVAGNRGQARALLARLRPGREPDYPPDLYLPDTSERVREYQKMIAGRDMAVFATGPSLASVKGRLPALGGSDLIFFGFNGIPSVQLDLLGPAGLDFNIACLTSAHQAVRHGQWYLDFLARPETNFLFLTNYALGGLAAVSKLTTRQLIARFPGKVIIFHCDADFPPVPSHPLQFPSLNTLLAVMGLAVVGKPRRIFLFGADGNVATPSQNPNRVYFQESQAVRNFSPDSDIYQKYLAMDTALCSRFLPMTIEAACNLHQVQQIPIYNCNPQSALTAFPKVSLEEAIALRKGQ